MKPKCLLVMSNFIGINKLVEENLSAQYEVDSIIYSFDNQNFKYKNIFQKIKNFYQKNIVGNKNYKKELKNAAENERIQSVIKKLNRNYDIVLLFNLEYFNEDTLQLLKPITKKMVAYQWDGLKRTPEIMDRIKYFDKFFTFSPEDINGKNIFFATNFFLDIPEIDNQKNSTELIYDLLYIGTLAEDRLQKLEKLIIETRKSGQKFKIILLSYGNTNSIKKKYPYPEIEFITQSMDYKTVLSEVLKTKAILDLKLSVHNGLSFRFFEGIHYRKKIITDNSTVKDYDFYNPNNIFVIHHDNYDAIGNFLKTPYQEIPAEIAEQYRFENWVKKITE